MGTGMIIIIKSLIITVYLLDVILYCNNEVPHNLLM